jgi:hypothetical protein
VEFPRSPRNSPSRREIRQVGVEFAKSTWNSPSRREIRQVYVELAKVAAEFAKSPWKLAKSTRNSDCSGKHLHLLTSSAKFRPVISNARQHFAFPDSNGERPPEL